jgi:hypothetical protein
MTPADKRVLELLDRWLTSIELHLKYVDLDGPSYQQVQPWPVHERPGRWILEMAQQKVLQLKSLCQAQLANNDPAFAESLELMGFLANLVGAQNITRFIPLADPDREQSIAAAPIKPAMNNQTMQQAAIPVLDSTREMPAPGNAGQRGQDAERTREMPKLKTPVRKSAVTSERMSDENPGKRAPGKPVSGKAENSIADSDRVQALVVADAVRLLKWGREWHELAESIARMAERPAAPEIRRILRSCKQRIEAQLRN